MASVTNNTTLKCNAYSSNSWRLTATLTENSVGTSSQNTSNITITATLTSIQGSFATSANNTLEILYYDNNVYSGGTSESKVIGTLNAQASDSVSKTFNVTHKDNGTLTGYVIARWTKASSSGYPPNTGSVQTSSLNFTTIARYANITAFSVSKRNSNSFTGTFTTDATVDKAEYRVKTSSASSYGSWIDAEISEGTSKTIKIGGSLTANTKYNIQLRVRRKDSQLVTPDGSVSSATQTTYKLPTQTLSSKSEATINVAWTSDTTASSIWYSKDNGSTWTSAGSNASSGTHNITGLTPNITYNIKTKILRSGLSSGDEEISSNLAVTTYKDLVVSLKSKTETSFTFNWSADSQISKIEYRYKLSSASSYGSWTNANITAGTSGTLSISSLTANSTYDIQFRVTRTATSSVTRIVSTVQTQTTYQYPYVSAVGTSNLPIGNSQTLTIYNPLSRNCTVYMKQTNTSGTQLYSGTTSATSITFTPTASTLYNSIPNSTSGTAVYYCVFSNQNVGTKTGTYTIDNSGGTLNPTFANTNWSYTANLTNLTNNNQVVIKGQSAVTFTIDTAPTFKYNATLKNYKLEWGTVTPVLVEPSSTSGSVQKGDSAILKVTAIDSRNYYTETSKTLGNNYIEYFVPTVTKKETHREDGIGTDTTLTLEGSIFNQNFGADGVLNEFISAKYYVSTDNSTWSNAFDISTSSFTYESGNKFKLTNYQIHEDGSSGGFTVGTRFYIKVDLTDKINTYTFTGITITDGKIAKDTYQDDNGEYHIGINGLADGDFALKVYGDTTTTKQFVKNIGGSFIQDRDLAPFRNNNASSSASYNPVISSKTKNGNWTIGNYNSDNLRFTYTTDSDYSSNNNKAQYINLSTSSFPGYGSADILHSVNTSYTGTYTEGIKNGTIKINGTDTDMYCRGTVYQKLENPSSAATYYLMFSKNGTNNTESWARVNNGLTYNTAEGTASADGSSQLMLGNNVASGTVGNKRGYLRLYDLTTYRVIMQTTGSYSNNRTMTFPNQTGTIQIRPTNLYNNAEGTTGTVTLSSSAANFNYLEIYYTTSSLDLYKSVKIYSPNGKTASLDTSHIYGGNTFEIQTKDISISGTSITVRDGTKRYGYMWATNGSSVSLNTNNSSYNVVRIVRVDGWV